MTDADPRVAEIRRRHRPGYDPRWHGRNNQCVRCGKVWPCDAAYLLERLDQVLVLKKHAEETL